MGDRLGRLHQHDLRAAVIVVEATVAVQDVRFFLVAVDEQHIREFSPKHVNRRGHRVQARLNQILKGLAKFVDCLPRLRQRVSLPGNVSEVKRVESAALLVVMEYHHLAAHRHVFADMNNGLAGLDGLEKVAPAQVVELVTKKAFYVVPRRHSILVVGL